MSIKLMDMEDAIPAPVFIVGVPRSGTTLLRVLFDSHPRFACGPEAPWLARGAHSLKQLYYYMADDRFGYVANFGVTHEEMRKCFARYVNSLFLTYAEKKGRSRWVEKTPENSLELPFLIELFPDAKFIHIIRDGRDVACSTAIVSEERKKISPWESENIRIDDGHVLPNTLLNAALRWKIWNSMIEESLKGSNSIRLRYEDLLSDPQNELTRILEFVGDCYEPEMLDFKNQNHDFPSWEWGSTDVKKTEGLSGRSLERWRKQLTSIDICSIEESIGDTLVNYGYSVSLIEKPILDARPAESTLKESTVGRLKRLVRMQLK